MSTSVGRFWWVGVGERLVLVVGEGNDWFALDLWLGEVCRQASAAAARAGATRGWGGNWLNRPVGFCFNYFLVQFTKLDQNRD